MFEVPRSYIVRFSVDFLEGKLVNNGDRAFPVRRGFTENLDNINKRFCSVKNREEKLEKNIIPI